MWKIETFIEEDTRYKRHCTQEWCLSPLQRSHLGTSHSSPSISSTVQNTLATEAWCSFCSGSRSCGMIFATTCFVPRSHVKISDIVGFGTPNHLLVLALSLIFVDCSPYMFTIFRCSACCRPSRTWITFNRFLTIFEAFFLFFFKFKHWSICAIFLFALSSSHHPWKPSESPKQFPQRNVQV